MKTTFAIYAGQVLAAYLVVVYLFLLAGFSRLIWRLVCWIADRKQRRPEPPATARDPLQELARLDEHLTHYADNIQPLYPTGEQQ